jgi:hypothetical protein
MSGGNGSEEAAQATRDAAKLSVDAQLKMYGETKELLHPYVEYGTNALADFKKQLPALTQGFNPSMQQLSTTPGYQFAMEQGLGGVQNGMASKGLARSGTAMRGAEQFAQGLASQTYQQSFGNDMAQKAQKFNMLMAPTQMGANAAAGQGGAAMALGANMGNTYQNMGNNLSSIYMKEAEQSNALFGSILGAAMGFL